jgi:hypothetical protein
LLVLRTLDGRVIANGELSQTLQGGRVTIVMAFRFSDGSLREETTVFTQDGSFRLLTHHLLRKGPTFGGEVETWLDALTGEARVRYLEDGEEKMVTRRLELQPDVANGLLFTLLKNVDPIVTRTTLSMVGFPPQSGIATPVRHFRVRIDLGVATGFVARLIGKQPPDIHMWITGGDAPEFLRFEGPLYEGGPVWRMEPVSAHGAASELEREASDSPCWRARVPCLHSWRQGHARRAVGAGLSAPREMRAPVLLPALLIRRIAERSLLPVADGPQTV